MKRRAFLKHSSLTTAGSLLISQLPLRAALNYGSDNSKHIIVCIVAGLDKKDFMKLFSNAVENSIIRSGVVSDIRYNGMAAGHRLATLSILSGKYLNETEAAETSIAETAIFKSFPRKKYLVTSNRNFLFDSDKNELDVVHLFAGINDSSNIDEKEYRFKVSSIDEKNQFGANKINHEINSKSVINSEDLFVAKIAAELCKNENPNLVVTHFMGADVAHSKHTLAQTNIKKIGQGIQQIWEAVESNPTMKGNTMFVIIPDFGRNEIPNSIHDEFGKSGSDHNIADYSTKKIACLMASSAANFNLFLEKNITIESTDILSVIENFTSNSISEKFAAKNL